MLDDSAIWLVDTQSEFTQGIVERIVPQPFFKLANPRVCLVVNLISCGNTGNDVTQLL